MYNFQTSLESSLPRPEPLSTRPKLNNNQKSSILILQNIFDCFGEIYEEIKMTIDKIKVSDL